MDSKNSYRTIDLEVLSDFLWSLFLSFFVPADTTALTVANTLSKSRVLMILLSQRLWGCGAKEEQVWLEEKQNNK